MIKKFEEFITESLWKSGIKRAKSGEERIEDKLNSNIGIFKEIDLGDFCPFYIANENLEIDGEEVMTFDEYKKHKSQIEKTGWRMPSLKEWKDYVMKYCNVVIDFPDDNTYNAYLVLKEYHDDPDMHILLDTVKYVSYPLKYWMEYDSKLEEEGYIFDKSSAKTFLIVVGSKFKKEPKITYFLAHTDSSGYKIRLVKDKK